jgi:hypothetical protein
MYNDSKYLVLPRLVATPNHCVGSIRTASHNLESLDGQIILQAAIEG